MVGSSMDGDNKQLKRHAQLDIASIVNRAFVLQGATDKSVEIRGRLAAVAGELRRQALQGDARDGRLLRLASDFDSYAMRSVRA